MVDDPQPFRYSALHSAEAFAVLVGLRAERLAPLPHPLLQLPGTLLRVGGEWRFESRLVRMDRPFRVTQMAEPRNGIV